MITFCTFYNDDITPGIQRSKKIEIVSICETSRHRDEEYSLSLLSSDYSFAQQWCEICEEAKI